MADRVAILDRGRVIQLGPPADLYRRPGTRFVAEFLGETNLIRARTDGAKIQTSVGLLTPANPPTADAECLVSIRPEAIRLAASGPNSLRGTIAETTYLGELAQHVIKLSDGTTVRAAEINPGGAPVVGTQVDISIDPADIVVISDD